MTRARFVGAAVILAILATVWLRIAHKPVPADPPRQAAVPHTAAEWYEQGRARTVDSRDLPGAIAAYREALSLDPGMGPAHFGLGLALLQTGDAEGAAAEIESAISLAPPDAGWRKDAENALVLALLRKDENKPK